MHVQTRLHAVQGPELRSFRLRRHALSDVPYPLADALPIKANRPEDEELVRNALTHTQHSMEPTTKTTENDERKAHG